MNDIPARLKRSDGASWKKRASRIVVVSLLVFCVLISTVVSCTRYKPGRAVPYPERTVKPQVNSTALEKQIHALINTERKRHGLSPLAWDTALAVIARKHSRDMAERNYFDHISPEGRDFLHRYRQEGYRCSVPVTDTIHMGAENLASNNLYDSVATVGGEAFYDWNSQTKIAETTVRGWLKSPGHRKNILMPHWRKEGVGVMIAPDGKVYITQNFC